MIYALVNLITKKDENFLIIDVVSEFLKIYKAHKDYIKTDMDENIFVSNFVRNYK